MAPCTSGPLIFSHKEAQKIQKETVTCISFEDYVRQNIFAPVEMKNSFASQDEALKLFVKGLIELAMIISHKEAQKAQKSAEPI
jgi:hypothetical protein